MSPRRPDGPPSRRERYLSLNVLGSRRRPPAPATAPEPPPNSVIDWGWYVGGVRQSAPDVATAARRAVADKHGFVWLGLKDPTDADLHALPQQFDLHPLAIEDAVEGHTRSKMEMFGDDMFMVISTVAYVEHQHLSEAAEVVSTGQVMIFLNEHFVITVRRGEHAPLGNIRKTLEQDPERLAEGPWTVLYSIADMIIDDYQDVVGEFETDVDEVEAAVFAEDGERKVASVYQLKRELIEFKRSVVPLGQPLQRLSTRGYPMIPSDAQAYFRELHDHHIAAAEAVSSFDEVLTSIMQAALARLSVSDNQDMRKLAAYAAMIAAPTALAGIYGMNFSWIPGADSHWGFVIFCAIIAAMVLAIWIGFKRNKWL
ncbi:magnesium and cobalt transport protein CorA [Microlunatus soli]|uniref:Magnesium transporter n=1 Tax=Microlunatus soli TaxID=630515 RepID=A0A1H1Q644_9ACTN|nr:magnesium and cobalt transport protein CorA [Microlunatus soli]SDS18844.1 magnesium transporter [Microlunatus soli]